METTDIKPKWTDIWPVYGATDYIFRTIFKPGEKRLIRDYVKRDALIVTQIIYNCAVGMEILNSAEGKPSLILKLLEKIF